MPYYTQNTYTHTLNPRISYSSEVRVPSQCFGGCGFKSPLEVKFFHLNCRPFMCQHSIICTQKTQTHAYAHAPAYTHTHTHTHTFTNSYILVHMHACRNIYTYTHTHTHTHLHTKHTHTAFCLVAEHSESCTILDSLRNAFDDPVSGDVYVFVLAIAVLTVFF